MSTYGIVQPTVLTPMQYSGMMTYPVIANYLLSKWAMSEPLSTMYVKLPSSCTIFVLWNSATVFCNNQVCRLTSDISSGVSRPFGARTRYVDLHQIFHLELVESKSTVWCKNKVCRLTSNISSGISRPFGAITRYEAKCRLKNKNVIFLIALCNNEVKENFTLHGASNRLSICRQMA